jgi:hypothetical protein
MSHEMAISTISVSKGLGDALPKSISGGAIRPGACQKQRFLALWSVQHAKEIDGVTWQ